MNEKTRGSTDNPGWKRGIFLKWFLLLVLEFAPSPAQSQQMSAGDVIRVRATQSTGTGRGWNEGSVVRLAPDTLWYQSSGSVAAMAWDDVELKRATGRNRGWSGLGIGAAAGGAIGALVTVVNFEPVGRLTLTCSLLSFVCPDDIVDPLTPVNSRARETATGVFRGALIGGGLGYIVGRMFGRWETVELDQLVISGGSLALGIRVRR